MKRFKRRVELAEMKALHETSKEKKASVDLAKADLEKIYINLFWGGDNDKGKASLRLKGYLTHDCSAPFEFHCCPLVLTGIRRQRLQS